MAMRSLFPVQQFPGPGAPPPQYTQNCFFSPTFQCYTSPPFYRTLLMELECVALHIDQCRAKARELVWKQLFHLLGAKPVTCSKAFTPVLKSWTDAPTINLLAIELLYLAFATAVDKNPEIFNLPDQPNSAPSFNPARINEMTAIPNKAPPTSQAGSINSPIRIESSRDSPPAASTVVPKPAAKPPSDPSVYQPTPKYSPPSPAAAPKLSEDRDFLQKLIDLQSWKSILDQQPEGVKQKIWRVWEGFLDEVPANLDKSSFTNNINFWAQNIATSVKLVTSMHSVITFLKTSVDSLKCIDESTPKIPSTTKESATERAPSPLPVAEQAEAAPPQERRKPSQTTTFSNILPLPPPHPGFPVGINPFGNYGRLPSMNPAAFGGEFYPMPLLPFPGAPRYDPRIPLASKRKPGPPINAEPPKRTKTD